MKFNTIWALNSLLCSKIFLHILKSFFRPDTRQSMKHRVSDEGRTKKAFQYVKKCCRFVVLYQSSVVPTDFLSIIFRKVSICSIHDLPRVKPACSSRNMASSYIYKYLSTYLYIWHIVFFPFVLGTSRMHARERFLLEFSYFFLSLPPPLNIMQCNDKIVQKTMPLGI